MTNIQYDEQNIFAKIIRGELPCNKVYEDDKVLAFFDTYPAAPKHILVIPKGRFVSFDDFMRDAPADLTYHFFKIIRYIIQEHALHNSGFRIITNHGEDGIQTIPHFHVHILGGTKLGPLLAKDHCHAISSN